MQLYTDERCKKYYFVVITLRYDYCFIICCMSTRYNKLKINLLNEFAMSMVFGTVLFSNSTIE